MLYIAVCDDIEEERSALRCFLNSYFVQNPYPYTITEYATGESLCDDISEGSRFDLIFLDIFMSGMSGIETARQLREYDRQAAVIFLTTTPDFALESYDVRAYGYLVKPLKAQKAEWLLDCYLREEYGGRQKTLMVREGSRGVRIPYREIEYIESNRNLLLVHLENEEVHRVYAKLDDVEQELASHGFLRCHQSFLINMERVQAALDDFVMESGTRVPIRQRGAKAIRDNYFEYILSQAERTRI
ncbi:LytR/AlgR family response regulator transcription factor [Qiania dongpingensis]|uniref:Stage 0 sporulation protein A homolog n=1 Tax=Qiania dongpingensis TaxID=2763669 RepID=A0A7G9G3E3_9FIRM|nr:LytTR family DNA-binding domain-containing protein [Qiania dongpingensis]QNM05325.1 response regulator transcription factor [Qiania dongpingensis]